MKRLHKIGIAVLVFCLSPFSNYTHAQQILSDNKSLSEKEKSIVIISSFTAKGDLPQLKTALHDGLNAGLTVNETKEALIQLYAYTGFPRSLNALNTFMAVLKERKAKGINDPEGTAAAPLPKKKTKLQFGTEMQTKLIGQPIKGAVYEFAPTIDQFLKLKGELETDVKILPLTPQELKQYLLNIENNKTYLKKYTSPYLCILNWHKKTN